MTSQELISFSAEPGDLPPLAARLRRAGRDGDDGGDARRRAARRLRAEAQLVRPQRRHRAVRRRPAAALRAPGGQGVVVDRRRRQGVLRRAPTSRCWRRSSHGHKVNFCKFTNETRNGIEDATANSGQVWIAAVNGTAAGGGYELALACDEILLIDDRASAVSLPEVPLLAVLPGTGGLTRVVDKRLRPPRPGRRLRHPHRGGQGPAGRRLGARRRDRPQEQLRRARRDSRAVARGRRLRPARSAARDRRCRRSGHDGDRRRHAAVDVRRRRHRPRARVRPTHRSRARTTPSPTTGDELVAAGSGRVDRSRRRSSSTTRSSICASTSHEIGTWVCTTDRQHRQRSARPRTCSATTRTTGWSARLRLFWTRTLKRLDVSARTLVTLIEPGSCFAGVARRAGAGRRPVVDARRHVEGRRPGSIPPRRSASPTRTTACIPMSNGLAGSRTRFWGRDDALDDGAGADRQGPRRVGCGRTPGSSRSRPTTSTGTTRCG